jgi:cytochrome c biogenesis protein CcdA/thiol-disulfide isomerase/thioredoxin
MLILLGFAFLSGLVTILAPCIWPLLPIILSASALGKKHQRPLGITLGIMLSFAVFTLATSYLVKIFNFNPNVLRLIAVFVIGILGLTLIIPPLSNFLELLVGKLSNLFGLNRQTEGSGFGAGFVTGLSLGIVWSPCAGPILASIATLAATGKVTADVVLVTLFYVLGVGIPLFIFAYGGQQIIARVHFISSHTGIIQQIFGVIMILTAIAIYTNYDQILQVDLLNAFPAFSTTLNSFEGNPAVTNQLNVLKGTQNTTTLTAPTSGLFNTDTPAPDFVGITKWLNTDKPISIESLKGKVVLVDFWTYSCINCIRSLPHITAWYSKYKDDGFIVIGIHTPEFQFEKDTNNVLAAIKQNGIQYPVGQDNNYTTWNNYNNQYWPADYLIDAQGNIRRTDFGEGNYNETEMAIQELLKESGQNVNTTLTNVADQTPIGNISPETYLGSARMLYFYPNGQVGNGEQTFTLTPKPPLNSFSFGGTWNITDEYAVAGANAVLTYHFSASKVYMVLNPGSSAGNVIKVKVFLDGNQITSDVSGVDITNGILTIDSDRLYNIVDLKGTVGDHILQFEFQTPGAEVYTFTFG